MKRLIVGAGVLLVTVGFLVWWFHPDHVLKRRTRSLLDTLTLAEGAGTAARNLKAYPLNRLLAAQVELVGTGDRRADGVFSRSEVESGFSWLATNARSSSVVVRRFEAVTRDGDRGEVRVVVDARVELRDAVALDGPHDVRLGWVRGDDGWRLESAEWRPR